MGGCIGICLPALFSPSSSFIATRGATAGAEGHSAGAPGDQGSNPKKGTTVDVTHLDKGRVLEEAKLQMALAQTRLGDEHLIHTNTNVTPPSTAALTAAGGGGGLNLKR